LCAGGDKIFENIRVEKEAILVMVFVCNHYPTDLSLL
jgi:hypothetical protein